MLRYRAAALQKAANPFRPFSRTVQGKPGKRWGWQRPEFSNKLGENPHAVFRFRGKIKFMSEEASELLRKALTLPVGERAELAGSLIESLDSARDKSVQAAWDEEIVRRMEELDSGKVNPVPLDEGRRRLSSAIE